MSLWTRPSMSSRMRRTSSQSRGHLASPRVVDADEQDFGRGLGHETVDLREGLQPFALYR
jgi:hypothetical protein